MQVNAAMVKELRTRTGAGMMDCKSALVESAGDMDKAIEFLRIKGLSKAAKKSGRETAEGLVVSYIHPGNRVGVLVEINCETDFVARTDEFAQFTHDIAMQIAATAPIAVRREDIPAETIDRERAVFRGQALEEGKPEKIVDKIVEGRVEKYYKDGALLDQVWVKDTDMTVGALLQQTIGSLGENIRIARFSRFELGG